MENSCSIIYWLPSRCDLRNGHIDLPDKMIKRRQKFITKAAIGTDLSWNCGDIAISRTIFLFSSRFYDQRKAKERDRMIFERAFIYKFRFLPISYKKIENIYPALRTVFANERSPRADSEFSR